MLSTSLELPATVAAGETVEGRLVVHNGTAEAVTVDGCGSPFGVHLGNDSVQQTLRRNACLQRFTLPVGESWWPVTVVGTYGSCVVGEPSAGVESVTPPRNWVRTRRSISPGSSRSQRPGAPRYER